MTIPLAADRKESRSPKSVVMEQRNEIYFNTAYNVVVVFDHLLWGIYRVNWYGICFLTELGLANNGVHILDRANSGDTTLISVDKWDSP